MNLKALEAIREYQMLKQGDRVCVALSGGADSVALLAFLLQNREQLGITVFACHLNHCLRGEESWRDEEFVRELCGRLGVSLEVRRLAVAPLAAERKCSVEVCGREERYRFFGELMEKMGCKLATAHTRSDSMETVLLNLTRGTGLRGMGGIAPVRGGIIRPLITSTRQEIEEFCAQQGLSYVTDSTNLTDDYTRNRIRHRVVPALYEINPAVHEAFAHMMETAAAADRLVSQLALEARPRLEEKGEYSIAGFLKLNPLVGQALLSILCGEQGVSLSHRHSQICFALLSKGGAVELGNQVVFAAQRGLFSIKRREFPQPPMDFFAVLELGRDEGGRQPLPLPGKILRWQVGTCEQNKNFSNEKNFSLKNTLDYDRIYGIVLIRFRRPGDALRIPGRGCTKTLKKLFSEAALSPLERSSRLVLSDDRGVLWVEGMGPDERVAVTPQTREALTIAVLEGETG